MGQLRSVWGQLIGVDHICAHNSHVTFKCTQTFAKWTSASAMCFHSYFGLTFWLGNANKKGNKVLDICCILMYITRVCKYKGRRARAVPISTVSIWSI